jgi:hypothetical protein
MAFAGIAVLGVLTIALGGMLALVERRVRPSGAKLVDAIDLLLPQNPVRALRTSRVPPLRRIGGRRRRDQSLPARRGANHRCARIAVEPADCGDSTRS